VNIQKGRGAEALALSEEALTLAIKTMGEESVDTALAYASVAEAHRYMGATERALPLYRKARLLYEKALGPAHPRVATLLSQEGLILMHDGKLSLAEQAMVQCLDILKKSCPDCVTEISLAETNLGLLRLRQKRWAEANEASRPPWRCARNSRSAPVRNLPMRYRIWRSPARNSAFMTTRRVSTVAL